MPQSQDDWAQSTKWKEKLPSKTKMLLKVLTKDSMKYCHLLGGVWQTTSSVQHVARILQNAVAGMRS